MSCRRCNGLGFVILTVKAGELVPYGFTARDNLREGAVIPLSPPAPCPVCNQEARDLAALQEVAKIPLTFRTALLPGDGDTVEVNAGNRDAVNWLLRRLPEEGPVRPRSFGVLWGGYGVGKTLLLTATVNSALRRGYTAAFASMEDILNHVRAGYSDNSAQARWTLWERADVLAIDELDRVIQSQWAEVQIFQLLNKRYEARCLTVASVNNRPERLPGYITSRAKSLEVKGVDRRIIERAGELP